jgi:hypothetical protein
MVGNSISGGHSEECNAALKLALGYTTRFARLSALLEARFVRCYRQISAEIHSIEIVNIFPKLK